MGTSFESEESTRESPKTPNALKELSGKDQENAEENKNQLVLQLQGHFALLDSSNMIEESDCGIGLTTDFFSIDSSSGAHYEFTYRDTQTIEAKDYSVQIKLANSFVLRLNYLGEKYQDFLTNLHLLRNDQLAQDLLILEGKASLALNGKISINTVDNGTVKEGEIRVYKTRIALFPENFDPYCLRFSDIANYKFEDYAAEFTSKNDSTKIRLSDLGEHFDQLQRYFTDANAQLLQETNSLIREIYPTVSSMNLIRLSRMLLDGIPAKFKDIESIEPQFLRAVELQVGEGKEDLLECLRHLYSIGDKQGAYVGAERLVTNYIYLMVPIGSKNAVALETNEEGRATYFFRSESERRCEEIANALRDVNYRREPIYLSEDELLKPRFAKYKFSIERIKTLAPLRKKFMGRAIHIDFDAWRTQVEGILKQS